MKYIEPESKIQKKTKKTASVIILQNKLVIGRRNVLMNCVTNWKNLNETMVAHNEQNYLSNVLYAKTISMIFIILSEFVWTAE